jgi:ABC-type multidrug transport system ATPase subunit
MIVVASIHQPSTSTLLLFDNVLLLSQGQTVYYGPPTQTLNYFSSLGHSPPAMMSPAEFMLELTNVDFVRNEDAVGRLETLVKEWSSSDESKRLDNLECLQNEELTTSAIRRYPRGVFMQSLILLHRMALV